MQIIKVRVTTRAKTEAVEEVSPGEFRVRTSAVPEGGKANARVKILLAEHLGIPQYKLFLKSGQTSREKVFIID